ncbi:MAG: heavy metal translocating P-type ATPase [Candidatus Paceibacterota bacterium]
MDQKKKINFKFIAAIITFAAIILFTILFFLNQKETASLVLQVVLFLGLFPIWYEIISEILKKKFGVDFIAGIALLGTFLFGEYLAGAIILLMLMGGQSLEAYAFERARKDLSRLLSRAPEFAHIKKGNEIIDIPIDEVLVDMIAVIKSGEVVPVDGIVVFGQTLIDEATLTGEPIPVRKDKGSLVYSGTVNTTETIEVEVTKPASESKYAQIIDLVKEAESTQVPFVRLADEFSLYFTAITFIIGFVTWYFTHDIVRVIAVLVVATPCPLILATPIAIISGISLASGRGIVVKNGGVLEKIAKAKTFIFDKTGTVTLGAPDVDEVFAYSRSKEEILKIASSLDQMSSHVLARSLVNYAKKTGLELEIPQKFKEQFGDGVEGLLQNAQYFFGKLDYIKEKVKNIPEGIDAKYDVYKEQGKIVMFLSDVESVLGFIVLSDQVRPDSKELFLELKKDGFTNIIMLTGDRKNVAEKIGKELGISNIIADCKPEQKLEIINNTLSKDRPVIMVGDGINDAPALASADVGIALGANGKTAASDSADAVLINPSIGSVHELVHISRHTMKVALQGILFGIGLSIVFMILGGFGWISPISGALIQEGIDVLVILNALRVSMVHPSVLVQ